MISGSEHSQQLLEDILNIIVPLHLYFERENLIGLLQIRTEGPPSNGTRDAGSMVTGQGVQTERNQCWDWRNGPGKTGGPRAGAPGCVGASPSHPDLTANSSRAFPMSGYFHPQGRNIKRKLFYFCVAFHLIIKDYDYIRERKYSKNTIS